MTIKFGVNPTMRGKAKVVEDRYGKTTGASKGIPAPSNWKVKPTGNPTKGTVGIKATKKL